MGMTIEQEPEFSRVKLHSVGYAIHAKYADKLSPMWNEPLCTGCIGGDSISAGVITGEHIKEGSLLFADFGDQGV